MTKRSVLDGSDQLTRGCPLARLASRRAQPRARNTDSLACSATETRDIKPPFSLESLRFWPRGPQDIEGLRGGQLLRAGESRLRYAPGVRQKSRRGRPCVGRGLGAPPATSAGRRPE